MSGDTTHANDTFEIIAALVLGLAAAVTAWATYRSAQVNGQCVEAYALGGNATTKASTEHLSEIAKLVRDSQTEILAKRTLKEADALDDSDGERADPLRRERRLARIQIAQYLYTQQMSKDGYEWLGLPDGYWRSTSDRWEQLTAEQMNTAFDRELGEAYYAAGLKQSRRSFQEADARFKKASEHDAVAGEYDLAVVLLTISMFFGGIAQVFKTRARWPILALSVLTLLASGAQILSIGA